MSTALKIITRAFSKAGIRPAESPLSDAEISDGLDVFNDLISSWNAQDILPGIRLVEDVNTETLIPREAEWAVKSTLAVLLTGEYGVQLSPTLATDADEAKKAWLRVKMNLQDIQMPPTLPQGSGNYSNWWDYRRDFFPNENDVKDNF